MTPEQQQRQGVFIEMPRGFKQEGKVLKLKKSLYGLKQSPRNFFNHLKTNLIKVGFEQMVDVDPCLSVCHLGVAPLANNGFPRHFLTELMLFEIALRRAWGNT